MILHSIVPYFGGKRSMADGIVQELGRPASYFELGCGSLAVLLAKPPSLHETAVDLLGPLTNLAFVLQDDALWQRLLDRLGRTLFSDALFAASRDFCNSHPEPKPPDLDAAYHYLVRSWQGYNGIAGTKRKADGLAVRFTPGGGGAAKRWRSMVESVPDWHGRLRNVVILSCDLFDVLPKIADTPQTAIYADPPYLPETRGGARYEHEFSEDDHERLADALGRFEHARVVVSYYDHPKLRELYSLDRWCFRDMARQKNLHAQNRRDQQGVCEAPEVLILNGPSYAQTEDERMPLFAGVAAHKDTKARRRGGGHG